MIHTPGRTFRTTALFAVLCSASVAFADDHKVEVQAEVVHLSKSGEVIDPPKLAEMKKTFDAQGLSFSSYKRLSDERLTLEAKKPVSVKLPNKKSAQVSLDAVNDGVAQVSVQMPPLDKVQYKLGREGSLFIDGGSHQGGKLVLVLSKPKE